MFPEVCDFTRHPSYLSKYLWCRWATQALSRLDWFCPSVLQPLSLKPRPVRCNEAFLRRRGIILESRTPDRTAPRCFPLERPIFSPAG